MARLLEMTGDAHVGEDANNLIRPFVSGVQEVYATGNATEYSYRSAFEGLFSRLGVKALNEPKRVKCGAPDFLISRGNIVIGHVEAKDLHIGTRDMQDVNKSQQERYKTALSNLLYTTSKDYPDTLRRIRFTDRERGKTLVFLTNDFILDPVTIAQLYRLRWQVELFFKWIKQHLRIKSFFGTSENVVKNQIWIAISVYVLVAIIRKRLGLDMSLHTILQILSLTPFEEMPLEQLLDMMPPATIKSLENN